MSARGKRQGPRQQGAPGEGVHTVRQARWNAAGGVPGASLKSATISVPAEEAKGRADLLIPIPERLQECLLELGPGKPADHVFACDPESVRRPFQNAVHRAGISGKVSFHTLRKTGADWLRQKGVSLEATQKYGGWKDIETLLRHYRNPSASELRAAAGHLDDLVGTANG